MNISTSVLTASLLFLLPVAVITADQTDPQLDELFLTLRHTDSPDIASTVESQIWNIWVQHDDEQIQAHLALATVAMDANPRSALSILNELIEDVPDFAEGWNKRATLFYLLGEYAASERDIKKTLELEPRHFGALSGLGLVYLAQEQYVKAKSAFEGVLLIHPHSRGVQQNLDSINDFLGRNTLFTNWRPLIDQAQERT